MKFSIQQLVLSKLLKMVAGVVEKRAPHQPVLSHVLMSLEGDRITLLACDQDIQIQVFGPVTASSSDGKVSLPFRKLADWCKSLPESSIIDFKVSGQRSEIKSNKTTIRLSCLKAEVFPAFPPLEKSLVVKIQTKLLKSLLQKTCFAMADQDVRYYLNSLLLEITPNGLSLVASDGHRLAINSAALPVPGVSDSHRLIIPRKSVQEINRVLSEEKEQEISISFSGQQLQLDSSEGTLSSVLFDGKYPDYHRLVPKNLDFSMTVKKEELKDALLRSIALLGNKGKGVLFQLSLDKLKLAASSDEDSGEEELEADYKGEPLEIAFNARYLLDYLQASSEEWVHFFFRASNFASLVKTGMDESSRYILMPIQI